MYNVLIVDDEPLARARLKRLLLAIEGVNVVGEAQNGIEAVAVTEALKPDIILMDIQMPLQSGLDAALAIDQGGTAEQPAPAIIFCTAYDQYALDAIKARASDYLLKPISAEDLHTAIKRVGRVSKPQKVNKEGEDEQKKALFSNRPSVVARLKTGMMLTPLDDIVYFTTQEKLVFAVTTDGREVIIDVVLKELVDRFPDELVRVHRSYVVNRAQLGELKKSPQGDDILTLRDSDKALTVSRRQLISVKRAFKAS